MCVQLVLKEALPNGMAAWLPTGPQHGLDLVLSRLCPEELAIGETRGSGAKSRRPDFQRPSGAEDGSRPVLLGALAPQVTTTGQGSGQECAGLWLRGILSDSGQSGA